MYDLEIDRIVGWISSTRAKKVLLQTPDGIRPYLDPLIEALEGRGISYYVSGSHTWGGCDISLREAEALGVTHIVHIGHHGPVRTRLGPLNVLFVPGRAKVDVGEVVSRAGMIISGRAFRRVGLLTTIQHLHLLEEMGELLSTHGLEVVVGKSPDPWMESGLVIGCDLRAATSISEEVDAFLVVAGGIFHALGVAIASGRPTFAADPYSGRVADVEEEVRRIASLRLYNLSKLLDAQRLLIVVSIKPGQFFLGPAERARELLRGSGRTAIIGVFDEVTREGLENMGGYDGYINASCPRLALDDAGLFPGPVANLGELRYILRGSLEEYSLRDSMDFLT